MKTSDELYEAFNRGFTDRSEGYLPWDQMPYSSGELREAYLAGHNQYWEQHLKPSK